MAINNEDKRLWATFCPDIFKEGTKLNKVLGELKDLFGGKMIWEDYELYNYVEKTILDMDLPDNLKEKVKDQELKIELILQKIKWLSMQVSRQDPSEWNLFLDVLLIS